MVIHLNIFVSGHVQRVGYRYHAQKIAAALGITGFVKNMPDGSVYIEAEGEQAILAQFIKWCREGPSMAKVDRVNTEQAPFKGFSAFEIR
jgi:acylphosphatase